MSIIVILTLVMAFVITCFGIFNTEVVTINLFGIRDAALPLSFFFFFVFMIGAVFSAILCIHKQVEQAMTIRKLKRRVQEYKILIEEQEAAEKAQGAEEVPETVQQEEVPELTPPPQPKRRTSFLPVMQKKKARIEPPAPPAKRREPAPAAPPQQTADEGVTNDETDLDDLSAAEGEDEAGLSARLKEIALRRMRNG